MSQYNISSPLLVSLGDVLAFICPSQGKYVFSNIWVHKHPEQFIKCDCTASPEATCDAMVFRNGVCSNSNMPLLIINNNNADLASVINFLPGERNYIVSHCSEQSLAGALTDDSSGGQCLEGLKMVVQVRGDPSLLPDTTTAADVDATNVPTGGGASGSGGNSDPKPTGDRAAESTDPVTRSFSNGGDAEGEEQVEIREALEIKDWHVAMIVVLGMALLVVTVSFVVGGALALIHWRRKRNVIADGKVEEPESIDKKLPTEIEKEKTLPRDNEAQSVDQGEPSEHYRRATGVVFNDPLL